MEREVRLSAAEDEGGEGRDGEESVRLKNGSRWSSRVVAACQCIGGGARIGKVGWSDMVSMCGGLKVNWGSLDALQRGMLCYIRSE